MKPRYFTPRDVTAGGILRLCNNCHTHRDSEELFEHSTSKVCLLCERKPELEAGRWERSRSRAPVRNNFRRAMTPATQPVPKVALIPADRRRQLEADGKYPDEIAAIMAEEFPTTKSDTPIRDEESIKQQMVRGEIDVSEAMHLMRELHHA